MKLKWLKIKVNILSLMPLMGLLITSTHASFLCCGDEDEPEVEMRSRSPYSSLSMQREAGNRTQTSNDPLKTHSKRLSQAKILKLSDENYPAITPTIFNDGSKVTHYKLPPRLYKYAGALMGRDDRIHITNTVDTPWRVHGHLEMQFPSGKYIGSGTMINHRHVLTAGHCLYDPEAGEWASSIKFIPAQNGSLYPIKPAYATHLLTVKGWKELRDSRFDMGMVVLDRDLGEETGWHGLSYDIDSFLKGLTINVTGYPGDKENGTEMWTMAGNIKSISAEQFTYTLDTTPGQSGSAVWTKLSQPEGYYCVGIHTQGRKDEYNTATRISSEKFDRLVSWLNTDW